jgi:hypothetical protein
MQIQIRLFLIASLLLVGAPVFAKGKPSKTAEPTSKESREREARKACLEGDYARGVSILSDLFLDSKNPTYIFNQGRCYEQAERYTDAVSRFREYLRTPGSEDPALAQKHIAECEELEAKKNPPVVAPAAQPATQPMSAMSVPKAQPEQVVVIQQPQPASSSGLPGSGLRVTGVVIASVGVAGLVTGVLLNLKANSLANSITPPNTYDRSKESTRQSYETFSWVGYGVGAGAIVTGAILYGVGWSKAGAQRGESVALLPAVGPGLVGASLRGAF